VRSKHLWWEGRPTGRAHQEQAIDHYAYLALMGLCLLLTLPLEFVFGARVYRRFRALVLALLPEVVLFSVWDIVGIARDHWTYNPRFVTGFRLPFQMPIEELVFFLVVPICGVLTYEAVGVVLGRVRRRRSTMIGRRRAGA
jgi:lycopene cyclase domain-containing protein